MSLIQDALERAHNPEPEAPKPVMPQHEEPRLQNIKFYETLEKKEPVQEVAEKPEKKLKPDFGNKISDIFSSYKIAIGIGALVLATFLIGKIFLPSSKVVSHSVSQVQTESVILKTETPITQRTVAQVKFLLTGITTADGVQLALINNQVVGVGDILREKATVKAITANTVTLEWEGRQITLSL
jgi:hypothetical protein